MFDSSGVNTQRANVFDVNFHTLRPKFVDFDKLKPEQ